MAPKIQQSYLSSVLAAIRRLPESAKELLTRSRQSTVIRPELVETSRYGGGSYGARPLLQKGYANVKTPTTIAEKQIPRYEKLAEDTIVHELGHAVDDIVSREQKIGLQYPKKYSSEGGALAFTTPAKFREMKGTEKLYGEIVKRWNDMDMKDRDVFAEMLAVAHEHGAGLAKAPNKAVFEEVHDVMMRNLMRTKTGRKALLDFYEEHVQPAARAARASVYEAPSSKGITESVKRFRQGRREQEAIFGD